MFITVSVRPTRFASLGSRWLVFGTVCSGLRQGQGSCTEVLVDHWRCARGEQPNVYHITQPQWLWWFSDIFSHVFNVQRSVLMSTAPTIT